MKHGCRCTDWLTTALDLALGERLGLWGSLCLFGLGQRPVLCTFTAVYLKQRLLASELNDHLRSSNTNVATLLRNPNLLLLFIPGS